MKLTDDDFTSHTCDDPSKDGDGLGWNLDTDLTTEGKDELIQNQKLRELIEKRQKDARDSGELSDYDCGMIYDVIQKLLEESKK